MARIDRIAEVSAELADTLTGIIRSAYAAGDLVPGLPTADGAQADAAELLDDLAAGCPLWTAEVDGRPVGTVRAVPRGPRSWEVRRLAMAPWLRGAGVARALMRRLEADAAAAGATRVVLDAVVERGNPAFYAGLGYRTVRHFPTADKPLSEVHMRRDLDAPPAPVPYDGYPEEPGLLLVWCATPGGTVCRFAPTEGAPGIEVCGVDFLPGAGPAEAAAVRKALGRPAFDAPVAEIPAFRMPRLVHPGLLAWWRSPAVQRPAVPR